MDETIIAKIGGLLALCGIASFRSFLPTFLLLVMARLAPGLEDCPQALLDIASQVPEVMLNDGVLALFGVLAAAELVANWNDTVRQILEDSDFDLYFKPFYAFVFAIVAGTSAAAATAPAQANVSAAVATAVPPAPEEGLPWLVWVWNIITAGAAGFGTWVLCSFRSKVASTLRSIDPDNVLHLHTLAKLAEETTWVAVLFVALLVPVLAAMLVAVLMAVAAAFRAILARLERRCSHPCASCGMMVHHSAVVCPGCRETQPLPYRRVGPFALASSASVNPENTVDVVRHHRRLLSAHRCPICASPLRDGVICDKCGSRVWEQGVTRHDFVGMLDGRVIAATLVGIVLSVVPVFGFLIVAAAMNIMAISVLRSYESRLGRITGKVFFKVVKWTLIICAVALSTVPFVGIMLLMPYLAYYLRLRSRFLAAASRNCAIIDSHVSG